MAEPSRRSAESRTPSPPRRGVVVVVVVAWMVTVAAQLTAALWGAHGTPEPGLPGTQTARPSSGCGGAPCRVVASTVVNGMPVELLTDSRGRTGRLRAGGPTRGTVTDTGITATGARLNHNSLRCSASATPVCLIRGHRDGGMAGEVHVWRGDSWHTMRRTYFSAAGAVVLDEVVGAGRPEVVVVRHACAPQDGQPTVGRDARCAAPAVLAETLTLQGERVGCTHPRDSVADLTNWPNVKVRSADLVACPRTAAAG